MPVFFQAYVSLSFKSGPPHIIKLSICIKLKDDAPQG